MPMKPKSYIIETIKEIYETHQIGELGFDIVALCKNMGYAVIPYSSLSQKKQEACLNIDYDGFSLYDGLKEMIKVIKPKTICIYGKISEEIRSELSKTKIKIVQFESEYSLYTTLKTPK